MKTKTCATILLLLAICTAMIASEDPTEQAEYLRKKQELDLLAQRFKAETGFTGEILYSYEQMSLGVFEGKFSGITITSTADTTAFRGVFNQILDKVLPYTKATRDQLKSGRIKSKWGDAYIEYYQVVNGYRVESAGWIGVKYDSGRNRFVVSNNTVELPSTGTNPVLKFEDAVRIYDENVEDDETIKSFRKRRPFLTLFFSNIYNDWEGDLRREYRLCWVGGYTKCIYIDALTGHVYKIIDKTMYDYTVNVTAEVLLNSDNFGLFTTTSVPLDSTWVCAICDSIPVPEIAFTDSTGNYNFQCSTISDIESYLNSVCGINVLQNSFNQVKHNSPISYLPNLNFNYYSIQGNPSNLYYHALRFRDKIRSLMTLSSSTCYYDSTHFEPIVIADCSLGTDENGTYTPNQGNSGLIRVSTGNGNYSSTLCHEVTHDFVYRSLQLNKFRVDSTQEIKGAMDEAFSSYFPCMYRNNGNYRSFLYTEDLSDTTITVENKALIEYPNITINEDIYSRYHMRFPVASAWWDLRNNHIFGQVSTDINAVDTLLIKGLDVVYLQLSLNPSYRYKPRYFYNTLMKLVDNDNEPTPLNAKQVAIKDAYNSRGLHFYPNTESYSGGNKGRNVFSPGDSVFVKLSNYPQNTAFTLYVIDHSNYEYVDGAPIPSSSCYAPGFVPVYGTTSAEGTWTSPTPVWIASGEGEYDIIVDIGSPTTPDGIIHFTFSGANVMDGIDGRTAPGFMVIDNGIDVVMAVDMSYSMQNIGTHITKSARNMVSKLRNGDRVNVFGFGATTNNGDFVLNSVGTATTSVLVTNNQMALACSIDIIPQSLNTNLITPFSHGISRFDYPLRKSGFVLLSDGWHYIVPNQGVPNVPDNIIQGMITDSYLPSNYNCYTISYRIPYPNPQPDSLPYNHTTARELMNNIASWGQGRHFHYPNPLAAVIDSYASIDSLLYTIRGEYPIALINIAIPRDSLMSVPFLVDHTANGLRVALTTKTWYSTDPGYTFFLTSPSGISYSTNNQNIYSYYPVASVGKYIIPYPESGTWHAFMQCDSSYESHQPAILAIDLDSDIQIEITEPPMQYQIDVPVQTTVKVLDYLTPIADATVHVKVSRGTWEYTQPLFDDGCHNDGSANDGVYGDYIYFYHEAVNAFNNVSGDYLFTYTITSPSSDVSRVMSYKSHLLPPANNPYASEGRILHNGWNWVGFPRLQREGDDCPVSYATLSIVPHLTDVFSETGSATYVNNTWVYEGLSQVNSRDGYKLRIRDGEPLPLYELGTLIDTLSVVSLVKGKWNWLTYPCYAEVYALDALKTVLRDIDQVMAENWCMKKEDGVWVHDGFSLQPKLKYGDSIMVWATASASFCWNPPTTPPDGRDPLRTTYYTYEDKPDYETFMIDMIEDAPEFLELGVFQNENCIGGRVFEGYPMQVLAYSDSTGAENEELEFRIYSGNKSEHKLLPVILVQDTETYTEQTILPSVRGFRHVVLKSGEDNVPPVFKLYANYPNPFNPTTTIKFSIPVEGMVRLFIYNIKGQKVCELVNQNLLPGMHSIVWNGRDKNNRSVGSGIYFSRLEHGGQMSLRKMALVK